MRSALYKMMCQEFVTVSKFNVALIERMCKILNLHPSVGAEKFLREIRRLKRFADASKLARQLREGRFPLPKVIKRKRPKKRTNK